MNLLQITATNMPHFMVASFSSYSLTILRRLLRANFSRFGLAIPEFPSTHLFPKQNIANPSINLYILFKHCSKLTTLHYFTLHYTTLHYTKLNYTRLHCTTQH